MNPTKTELNILWIVLAAAAFFSCSISVSAHGGEDHGEGKASVVSTETGMLTGLARVGDYEAMIEHPPLVPDKAVAARLFITRFATNEPIEEAHVTVTLTGEDNATVEAAGSASSTPGIYEVKLPPLPQGQYKLAARVEAAGTTGTAQYGVVQIRSSVPSEAESSSLWARAALIVLALLCGVGAAAAIGYRVLHGLRRNRVKETATA